MSGFCEKKDCAFQHMTKEEIQKLEPEAAVKFNTKKKKKKKKK